jgi:hypothetical protein
MATLQTDRQTQGRASLQFVFIRDCTLVNPVAHAAENHHTFVSDVPQVPLQTLIY